LERLNRLFWDTEKGGIQCQPLEVYAEIFKEAWEELRSKFIKQAENFSVDFATRGRSVSCGPIITLRMQVNYMVRPMQDA
jgi:hypothetical protein